MPDREERFAVIIDAVEALCGTAPHVVDLGSGPGSLSRRILDRLPGARVTAIDMDPVLLAIGRNALGDHGGRLHWLDADLRSRWSAGADGGADAAVSTTALHWLQPNALAALYRHLGTVLRPGGVFVNGDRMEFPPDLPRLAGAARAIRERAANRPRAAANRGRSGGPRSSRSPASPPRSPSAAAVTTTIPTTSSTPTWLRTSRRCTRPGFSEVGTIWQHLADRVLVAIR